MALRFAMNYPYVCLLLCLSLWARQKNKQENVQKNLRFSMYLNSIFPQLQWCSGYSTRLVVNVEQACSEFESSDGQNFFEKRLSGTAK